MNLVTYFIGNQQKKESGCGLFGAKFAQIRYNVVKKQRNWHFNFFFHILHEVYIQK